VNEAGENISDCTIVQLLDVLHTYSMMFDSRRMIVGVSICSDTSSLVVSVSHSGSVVASFSSRSSSRYQAGVSRSRS
jgi:hypothetical protein